MLKKLFLNSFHHYDPSYNIHTSLSLRVIDFNYRQTFLFKQPCQPPPPLTIPL